MTRLISNNPIIEPNGTLSQWFREYLMRQENTVNDLDAGTVTQAEFDALAARVTTNEGDIDAIEAISKGWKDLTSAVSSARVPPANAPTATNFGPAHTPQRREFAFSESGGGDYVFLEPFHVNHDILNADAYIHVHWSTDGTDTGNVQWQLTILRALGHDQASFGTPIVKTVEQAASGAAWRHMIAEVDEDDVLTFTEPDELLLITLRRIPASSDECTDTVFGLTVDFHYYSDRDATPNRAPNFYT